VRNSLADLLRVFSREATNLIIRPHLDSPGTLIQLDDLTDSAVAAVRHLAFLLLETIRAPSWPAVPVESSGSSQLAGYCVRERKGRGSVRCRWLSRCDGRLPGKLPPTVRHDQGNSVHPGDRRLDSGGARQHSSAVTRFGAADSQTLDSAARSEKLCSGKACASSGLCARTVTSPIRNGLF
jgi:hypothetical protein